MRNTAARHRDVIHEQDPHGTTVVRYKTNSAESNHIRCAKHSSTLTADRIVGSTKGC